MTKKRIFERAEEKLPADLNPCSHRNQLPYLFNLCVGYGNASICPVGLVLQRLTIQTYVVVSAAQESNTMVAIQIKLDNQVEGPLWIKQIQAEVEAPDGKKYSDSAAPAVDAPRYVEAFPALGEAKVDWLKEDLKIPTKMSFNGVAIFSFPVDKPAFDKRKQVTMRIQLYDRPTLVAVNTPTPVP
jgi:hypothetical protein